jgi:hypothetical protein
MLLESGGKVRIFLPPLCNLAVVAVSLGRDRVGWMCVFKVCSVPMEINTFAVARQLGHNVRTHWYYIIHKPRLLRISTPLVPYSYSSPDIIRQVKSRRMRWAGHVARMGEERKVYKVLVGKPEGKRPLGRPMRRWEDGIRMDLREIGLGCVDWIRLAQDRDRWRAVVSAVMNLLVLAPRS